MGASGDVLFITFIFIPILFISCVLVFTFNSLFCRFHYQTALIVIYVLFIFCGCVYLLESYSDIDEMNFQLVPLTDNQASIQFKAKAPGPYDIFLVFRDAKTNETNKRCEFVWLENRLKKEDCIKQIIYRKIGIKYDNESVKSFSSQLRYATFTGVFLFTYPQNPDHREPGLRIDTIPVRYTQDPINFHVFIDSSTEEILQSKAAILVAPNLEYYYSPYSGWLIFIAMIIPFLCSIFWYGYHRLR